ncbi:dCTP deaminase domain-containing protein [Rhizorhabdus dicambivorans]|uniref:dCTP deaminase domain-containing protein n=1 Tax=Rhizorhabdus dicambivorans TaxID=1850238 RepID=UPI0011127032|nr:hypothetical protein [Rhizorhabdus dicambivorans]
MLIVIVGPRGAGKSTLQDRLRAQGIQVLKPSTTRKPRDANDKEYNFVTKWNDATHAWKITVGPDTYGMRWSELNHAAAATCATVFDPMSLEVFQNVRETIGCETMTVGLATIDDTTEQARRVAGDATRLMDEKSLKRANAVVAQCDIVLQGDADTVAAAVLAMLDLLKTRGGVVTKEHLAPLVRAGALLSEAEELNIRSASYDLRIGPEILCQGKMIELSNSNSHFEIPPYSYAIVSALEHANLPPFIIGRFDLKVSYFFEGIILSNGPQIDPGYKGALFCMLYNGSGRSKLLTLGRQFATIDFTTTTAVAKGYSQKYQLKQKMAEFVTDQSVTGRGGAIVELIEEKISGIDNKVEGIKRDFWAIAAAGITFFLAMPAIIIPVAWIEIDKINTARSALEDAQKKQQALLALARRERDRAGAMADKIEKELEAVRQSTPHGPSGRRANSRSAH